MKNLLLSITKYIIAEYIWIDSNNKLRSKSKTLYIKNYTDLHPSVFNFKILSEFPLNKNLKTAYNNESLN